MLKRTLSQIIRGCVCRAAVVGALGVLLAGAGPFRCDGQVQFRPCGQEMPDGQAARSRRSQIMAGIKRLTARVEGETFRRVGRIEGIWRGFVRGHGPVHLRLQILEGSQVASDMAIGDVSLDSREPPVRFTFKSVAPHGEKWSWRILALPGA